ncbi:3'-5' exonuclease [Candidatus Kaiserbacteria bacterium]|nr:3'-5' exonuclease [Candidatus Kaiserbacteria bacterium]
MIFVDIEASGVVYGRHSIVSLGAIDFENPKNRLYIECRIWEGAEINDESLAVPGFSREEVTDPTKMPEGEAVRQFLEWSQHMADRTLAGQNVSFDRDFLRAAAEREGLSWDMAHRTLDTHSLCWMHMVKCGIVPPIDAEHRRSALNLEAVAEYAGIPAEPEPHNALTGAMVHAEITSRLLYDKKLLPEFEQYDIPWVG